MAYFCAEASRNMYHLKYDTTNILEATPGINALLFCCHLDLTLTSLSVQTKMHLSKEKNC